MTWTPAAGVFVLVVATSVGMAQDAGPSWRGRFSDDDTVLRLEPAAAGFEGTFERAAKTLTLR